MRRTFIAIGIGVFLVYCWASVAYQNQVDVPAYEAHDLDLLGGKTLAAWNADAQAQFQRLMELEDKKYQLPPDARIDDGEGGVIPPDRPLASEDFTRLIGGNVTRLTVRDPSAIYALLDEGYLLRDSIPRPGNPDGPPLYAGGQPLHKDMLEALHDLGHERVTVTGHGPPVTFLPGTAVMIAVIFLTLAAALKPMLWDPFVALLEKRRNELELGAEAERQNQLEAVRFDDERRSRGNQLHREMQALAMKHRNAAMREADAIVGAARDKEREVKFAGLLRLTGTAEAAQSALEKDIPGLAGAIADALTPGRDSAPGDADG